MWVTSHHGAAAVKLTTVLAAVTVHMAAHQAAPVHQHTAHPATHHVAATQQHHATAHNHTRHVAHHVRKHVTHVVHHRARHPYRMYDSAQVDGIPSGQAAAVYATGSYTASTAQTRRLGHVMWIDVTGTDYEASALDVENGDATPYQAGLWAMHRLLRHPHSVARIYMNQNDWPTVRSFVRAYVPARLRSHVHWWVADPTGSPHLVPGSDATQWGWTQAYDQSTVRPGF